MWPTYDNFLGAAITIPDPGSVFPDPVLQFRSCPGVDHGIYAAVAAVQQAPAEHPRYSVSKTKPFTYFH